MTTPIDAEEEIGPEEMREAEQILKEMIEECVQAADPLSCVLDTLSIVPDVVCKPRLVRLVGEDCPACDIDKERYAEMVADGTIQEVDAESAEGIAIMDKNSLKFLPSLVLLDCDNKLLAEVFPAEDGDLVPDLTTEAATSHNGG